MSETVPTSKGFHSSSCQCGLCVPPQQVTQLGDLRDGAIEVEL